MIYIYIYIFNSADREAGGRTCPIARPATETVVPLPASLSPHLLVQVDIPQALAAIKASDAPDYHSRPGGDNDGIYADLNPVVASLYRTGYRGAAGWTWDSERKIAPPCLQIEEYGSLPLPLFFSSFFSSSSFFFFFFFLFWDEFWDDSARVSQLYATPHAPWYILYHATQGPC